jgi:hypothetical protein
MRLAGRTARRHDTVGAQKVAGVDPTAYWDYKPGQRVMTVDGYPGVVTAVIDGPHAGNEHYEVALDGGMGGGQYVTGQLRPAHDTTASTAATQHTADADYPELSQVLRERPDPALDQVIGRRVASMRARAMEYSPEIETAELANPGISQRDPELDPDEVENNFDEPAAEPRQGALSLLAEAAVDPDLRFHLTAAWRDVREKAKRIRAGGGVHIKLAQGGIVIADVHGDTAVYETGIQRMPGRQAVAQYSCGCRWGAYHWGADDDFSRFAGRMCSHALALQYEAQSRGMFGRDVHEDASQPAWLKRRRVVVKYDIDDRENITRAAALSEPPVRTLVAAAVRQGEDPEALSVLLSVAGIRPEAAVNNAWGEPTPDPPAYLPGPTTPRNPYENPASAGPLSSADPKTWQNLQPSTRVRPSFDRMGTLHDEPEPALPETDGAGDNGVEYMAPDFETPAKTAALDDAMFEPDITKTANPALLLAAVPEIAAAGEAAAGAGGIARTVGPMLPGLMGGGESHGGGADMDEGATTGEEAIQRAHSHASLENPLSGSDGDLLDDEFVGVNTPHGATASLEDARTPAEVVAAFQMTAGAGAIMAQGPGGGESDVAAAAREHLAKSASREFSAAEQAELINEGVREGVRARNLDRLDITGTHYAHLGDDEDDGELFV